MLLHRRADPCPRPVAFCPWESFVLLQMNVLIKYRNNSWALVDEQRRRGYRGSPVRCFIIAPSLFSPYYIV